MYILFQKLTKNRKRIEATKVKTPTCSRLKPAAYSKRTSFEIYEILNCPLNRHSKIPSGKNVGVLEQFHVTTKSIKAAADIENVCIGAKCFVEIAIQRIAFLGKWCIKARKIF